VFHVGTLPKLGSKNAKNKDARRSTWNAHLPKLFAAFPIFQLSNILRHSKTFHVEHSLRLTVRNIRWPTLLAENNALVGIYDGRFTAVVGAPPNLKWNADR
jgi:hypothetical protein